MDEDENPGLVYGADDGSDPLHTSNIPLVLIHDGGGTCFSYYCLNPIGRPVYEIHNPHFHSGKPWPGGIPEMARHYVGLMRKVVPWGRILLGGWSLGGLLSLEMARILANDHLYRVIGIVMVDSICMAASRSKPELKARVVAHKPQFGPSTKQETKEAVERCFAEARKAVETYELPSWEDGDTTQKIEKGTRNGTIGKGHWEGGPQIRIRRPSSTAACPRSILLRAMDAVPAEPDEVSFVDISRDDRTLGWDAYRHGFFEEIVDIPGHHFSIFAWEHIDNVSEKLRDACRTLEKLATPKFRRLSGVDDASRGSLSGSGSYSSKDGVCVA